MYSSSRPVMYGLLKGIFIAVADNSNVVDDHADHNQPECQHLVAPEMLPEQSARSQRRQHVRQCGAHVHPTYSQFAHREIGADDRKAEQHRCNGNEQLSPGKKILLESQLGDDRCDDRDPEEKPAAHASDSSCPDRDGSSSNSTPPVTMPAPRICAVETGSPNAAATATRQGKNSAVAG